ncbi:MULTISPECIES: hypothetical protein [Pseudomonas syringae group]|uniref:hypothetical protein n=1 Tax=Pseudomonas syringae group TaxID=136849 RepID=UPI001605313F|nr:MULTISPECIES: hypothetical protein [Pseudomonas syringae group]MCF5747450.1 hypothetical protein [Pseudomonas tremae]MCQ9393436.1 hypothetical protein [Pseudomonas viridiflava]UQB36678.1 hypothetical protein I9H09_24860 [Pseudomonas tremae]
MAKLMRTDERMEKASVNVLREQSRSAVIYSDEFAERKKKKEYDFAISQIRERAKKLDW